VKWHQLADATMTLEARQRAAKRTQAMLRDMWRTALVTEGRTLDAARMDAAEARRQRRHAKRKPNV
jgi:hypothetical protein